ncbi:hypothetical protein T492DRAFT_864372 [Pavlovales sp. CCMP2436]|nr:hypothetical protein T492DRAFT_864372 [Pavlovales sp. CCMP2436]
MYALMGVSPMEATARIKNQLIDTIAIRSRFNGLRFAELHPEMPFAEELSAPSAAARKSFRQATFSVAMQCQMDFLASNAESRYTREWAQNVALCNSQPWTGLRWALKTSGLLGEWLWAPQWVIERNLREIEQATLKVLMEHASKETDDFASDFAAKTLMITLDTIVFEILETYGDIAPLMEAFGVTRKGGLGVRRFLTRFLTDPEAFLAAVKAAFVPYFLSLFLLGIPMLLCELAVGQHFQRNALDAFASVNKRFKGVGIAAAFTGTMIVTYYMAIISWAIVYFCWSFFLFGPSVINLSSGPDEPGGLAKWPSIAMIIGWVITAA